jgi:hypothetical protein
MNDLATTDTIEAPRHLGRRLAMLLATLAASFTVLLGFTSSPAGAATGYWYSLAGHGSAGGSAIIDHSDTGYYTSHANGRVILRLNNTCGYIKYAPYANFAADGGYNKLATYCGTGSVTLGWSDSYHLAYDGFKFQVCTSSGCGSAGYIRFW